MSIKRNLLAWLVVLMTIAGGMVQAAPTTPTTDFTDNGDGTVTHRITGLTWKRCAEGMTWTGSTCTGTTANYTWAQATALTSSFAGSSDWRLPTIAELVTIVERDNYNPAIDTTIFPATPPSYFWSTSSYAGNAEGAWAVFFYNGNDDSYSRTYTLYARLVRGGQPLGSSSLYTPSSDFTDNGNGSVTHNKTRLTWKRCTEGQTWTGVTCSGTQAGYNWTNAAAITQTYAGAGDWRLPTQNELKTLVEHRIADPGPTINAAIFPNTPASYFWSASSDAGISTNAWYVGFDVGYGNTYSKAGRFYVRLVRGAQSAGATSTKSDSDRIFDWAEKLYPQYFPNHETTASFPPYTYRYYPSTGIYLATVNGRVMLTGGQFDKQDVGAVSDFLVAAKTAGY